MSAISQVSSGYTAVTMNNVGDAVAGRITGFDDYQVNDFTTKQPKFFPSGDPIMGTKIHLETRPGDEESRVTLWAEKANMLKAIAAAVRDKGAADIAEGADLAVTFTGFNGKAKTFTAAYSPAE